MTKPFYGLQKGPGWWYNSVMDKDQIVVGLLFGDEGKGTTVDWFASRKRPVSVVRFGGGPQTAHNVIHDDGTHHTFAQFGSASLRHVPTTLSRFMLVNPFNLVTEGDLIHEKTGWNPFPDLLISEKALLITPIHVWLNRKREEARGGSAHGSCGEGIGETQLFHIRHADSAPVMGDLLPGNESVLFAKLQALYEYAEEETGQVWDNGDVGGLHDQYLAMAADGFLNIVPDVAILDRINEGFTIFEGSQGVLLDESFGFHPHTTWSSVTSEHAQQLLAEAGKERGVVTGVVRSYLTRHGFGPFPSEVTNSPEWVDKFPEMHNTYGRYQGGWRRGLLDLPLLDYAVRANGGVDQLMLTHVDRFYDGLQVVTGYDDWKEIPSDFFNRDREAQQVITDHLNQLTLDDAQLLTIHSVNEIAELITTTANAPLFAVSTGPKAADKIEL